MKNSILYVLLFFFMTSCVSTQLYQWSDYDSKAYNYYRKQTPQSLEKMSLCLERIINYPQGERKTVPPGIYAEYGYLLIIRGNQHRGMKMLAKEVELYPESEVFVNRIIDSIKNENNEEE